MVESLLRLEPDREILALGALTFLGRLHFASLPPPLPNLTAVGNACVEAYIAHRGWERLRVERTIEAVQRVFYTLQYLDAIPE